MFLVAQLVPLGLSPDHSMSAGLSPLLALGDERTAAVVRQTFACCSELTTPGDILAAAIRSADVEIQRVLRCTLCRGHTYEDLLRAARSGKASDDHHDNDHHNSDHHLGSRSPASLELIHALADFERLQRLPLFDGRLGLEALLSCALAHLPGPERLRFEALDVDLAARYFRQIVADGLLAVALSGGEGLGMQSQRMSARVHPGETSARLSPGGPLVLPANLGPCQDLTYL